MSQNQALHFLTRVKRDQKLFNLLKSMPDMEAQFALAGQLGFKFTREELHLAMQNMRQDAAHKA